MFSVAEQALSKQLSRCLKYISYTYGSDNEVEKQRIKRAHKRIKSTKLIDGRRHSVRRWNALTGGQAGAVVRLIDGPIKSEDVAETQPHCKGCSTLFFYTSHRIHT